MFCLNEIKKLRMISIGENDLYLFIEKMEEIDGDYMIVYVDDCYTEYYSIFKERVVEPGVQLNFMINTLVNSQKAKEALQKRKRSKMNYMEFLFELAEAGISYYYVSFGNKMCSFYDSDDILVYQDDIARDV